MVGKQSEEEGRKGNGNGETEWKSKLKAGGENTEDMQEGGWRKDFKRNEWKVTS